MKYRIWKNVAIQKGKGSWNEILRTGDVICSSCNQGKNPSYVPPKWEAEHSKAGQISGLYLLSRDISEHARMAERQTWPKCKWVSSKTKETRIRCIVTKVLWIFRPKILSSRQGVFVFLFILFPFSLNACVCVPDAKICTCEISRTFTAIWKKTTIYITLITFRAANKIIWSLPWFASLNEFKYCCKMLLLKEKNINRAHVQTETAPHIV